MNKLTLADVLAMPLSDLKARVELAERLSIAVRLTPGAQDTEFTGDVQTPVAEEVRGRGRPPKDKKPKPVAEETVATVEEDIVTPVDFEGGDMMVEPNDFTDVPVEDDMFDFEESPKEQSTREKCEALMLEVQTTRDVERAKQIRDVLARGKFNRLADVPDNAIESLWKHLQKI